MTQHGLLFERIVPNVHWIFGGYKAIGGEVLQADRDWRPHIPITQEVQNKNGIEPFACTNFATDNCEETILKKKYGIDVDYSDRWFAKVSGTSVELGGNSPHAVAEFRRLFGMVNEEEWKFDDTITTVEKFYAKPPLELYNSATKVLAEYDFNHEWVPRDARSIFDALQYSPIGFTCYAWERDAATGMFFRPEGAVDTHMVELVYAEWEKFWLILDSYRSGGILLKKIRWDSLPMMSKRYSVTKKVHVFKKNLAFGIIDKEVAELQKALVALGYPIPHAVTNFYGFETRYAVSRFQRDNGISDDGTHFGPLTRYALNKARTPSATSPLGVFNSYLQDFPESIWFGA